MKLIIKTNLVWGVAHRGKTRILHKCVWEETLKVPKVSRGDPEVISP